MYILSTSYSPLVLYAKKLVTRITSLTAGAVVKVITPVLVLWYVGCYCLSNIILKYFYSAIAWISRSKRIKLYFHLQFV